MKELLSDLSAVRNMDILLQYLEESVHVRDVGRTVTVWRSAKKLKHKQSACTVREITMQGQHSV